MMFASDLPYTAILMISYVILMFKLSFMVRKLSKVMSVFLNDACLNLGSWMSSNSLLSAKCIILAFLSFNYFDQSSMHVQKSMILVLMMLSMTIPFLSYF